MKSPEILQNVIGGIIAGIVVLGLSYLWHCFSRWYIGRKFKDIFGCNNDYNIVYGLYDTPDIMQEPFYAKEKLKFPKHPRKGTNIFKKAACNLEKITSIATLESIGFLLYTFGKLSHFLGS